VRFTLRVPVALKFELEFMGFAFGEKSISSSKHAASRCLERMNFPVEQAKFPAGGSRYSVHGSD